MSRDFSVTRRRAHLLDVSIPKSSTTKGYILKAAANFDGTFTEIIRADISSGYMDSNVDAGKIEAHNNPGQIRIVFDPDTFKVTASIDDTKAFWLKFAPVSFAGVVGSDGWPALILPDSARHGSTPIVIAGNAPAGVDLDHATRLDLPFRAQNVRIENNDSTDMLYVAPDLGAEVPVGLGREVLLTGGAASSLWVRGNVGAATFCATFTIATGVNL